MLWQVRACLEDRPGALAALTTMCGKHDVNILALQVFPIGEDLVVDELVMHTPEGWDSRRVADLCHSAGVSNATVTTCAPQALEDQPVRYLRAGRAVLDDPSALPAQLCSLLGAETGDEPSPREPLEVLDHTGRPIRLARAMPFTDTEVARANALVGLAAALEVAPSVPDESLPVVLRAGTPADAEALVGMHSRCSAETLRRRFHVPMSRVSARLARALLMPEGGASIIACVGDTVVAHGMLAVGDAGPELGLLVEDGWQRQGLGSRILRALVELCAESGLDAVSCTALPGNEAVARTIGRAALRARVRHVDGVEVYRIPIQSVRSEQRRNRRPIMGELTAPLVELLHTRADLRAAAPAAALIDQAVRDGA